MRKKFGAYFALITIVVLLFAGCDALISNAYKSLNLGQPDPEKLKKEDAPTLIEQSGISSGTLSVSFIEAVISDEATKDAIIAKLEEVVDSGEAEDAQAAQALILDIKLADIGATKVVDNLNTAIGDLAALAESEEEMKPIDIIKMLLPPELLEEEGDLADFIDKIVELGADVDKFANTIQANGGEVAGGLDVATIAQTAIIIKFVEIIDPNEDYYDSTGQAVEALIDKLGNLEEDEEIEITDYFAKEPDLGSLGEDETLKTLFDAAGMSELLSQFKSNSEG